MTCCVFFLLPFRVNYNPILCPWPLSLYANTRAHTFYLCGCRCRSDRVSWGNFCLSVPFPVPLISWHFVLCALFSKDIFINHLPPTIIPSFHLSYKHTPKSVFFVFISNFTCHFFKNWWLGLVGSVGSVGLADVFLCNISKCIYAL